MNNKITLTLHTNNMHLQTVELSPERILCNDVTFPWEHNGNTRLWVIGNEYGAVCAAWATCEQDAIDEMVDTENGDSFIIDESDATDDTCRAGNAGEPVNLDYAWMAVVDMSKLDPKTLCRFAEARGQAADTLDF